MPRCHAPPPQAWRHLVDDGTGAGAHDLDLDTAVSELGLLGGGAVADLPSEKDKITDLDKAIADLDEDEHATVPAVFICPISLSPMSDPVTLCTGQTYDRANITRWLALGRRTCPTTMQELWDFALTPNSTLRHLLLAWLARRAARRRKNSSDAAGRAASLVAALPRLKGQPRLTALRELRRLPPEPLLAASAHATAASLLGPLTSHAVAAEAVAILAALLPHLNPFADAAISSILQPAKISLLVDMLNDGTVATKLHCLHLLFFLTGHLHYRPDMLASVSLVARLTRLARDRRHPDAAVAALALLSTISRHPQILTLLVSIGGIPQLVDHLPDLAPEAVGPALEVLSAVAATPDGSAALRDSPRTIPHCVRLLMRVPEASTRRLLAVLLAVCELNPGQCVPAAVDAGLAAKLLLVIQSGCGSDVKQMASELLKLCSLNCTNGLFISKCRLTRTMQ